MSRFVKNVRRALSLLRVRQFPIPQKEAKACNGESDSLSFAVNEVTTRNLNLGLYQVMERMRVFCLSGGRVLLRQHAFDCCAKIEHIFAVPTKWLDGRKSWYLTGRYSRRNPNVGIERDVIVTGDTACIGDSVIVSTSMKDGEAVAEIAGRLAGLFFSTRSRKQVTIMNSPPNDIMSSPESFQARILPLA